MRSRPRRARVERAVSLLRAGDVGAAERLLKSVAAADPTNADAPHFLGLIAFRQGDCARGIELVRHATALAPGYADAWNNLGNMLKSTGALVEAESAYRAALAERPADANALCNLGVVLRARGDTEGAERALRSALEHAPTHAEAWCNLGNLLTRRGAEAEALACYRASIAFDPTHPGAPRMLGVALYSAGRIDEAREVYRAWLEREPGNPVAAHQLAACAGSQAPPRASDGYVREVFDAMADGFDSHLARLDYRAPALVAEACERVLAGRGNDLAVLDAGCGTGLCAAALRRHARVLEGVDLSPAMLRHAARLALYDALIEAELTAHLEARPAAFDLVVSADTLCYFGVLEPVVRAAAAALRAGGWLVFTVEHARLEPTTGGYRLGPHGRYAHDEGYVRATLAAAGFERLDVRHPTLRTEGGVPVEGLLVTARKPPTAVSGPPGDIHGAQT